MAGEDGIEIMIAGNDDRMILTSRFDNLGKGASGAAVQNLNIMLGIDELEGLKNIAGKAGREYAYREGRSDVA